MTVIAYKAGVMAADTQATDGSMRLRVQKLARLQDGGVAGVCGEAAAGFAALNWLAAGGSQEGTEGRNFVPDIEGACVLIARPDGSLWMLEGRFPAYRLLDPFTAQGSGAEACLMAMTLGLDAVEAVKRVAKQDPWCSSPVQSMQVYALPDLPGAVTHADEAPKKPARKKPAPKRKRK